VVNDALACLQSGSLTSEACAKVLANLEKLAHLREECAKSENKDKDVCRELNSIPGLPPEPSLPIPPRSCLRSSRPACRERAPTRSRARATRRWVTSWRPTTPTSSAC
jgi:phospholipid/cholesterol/gamma-HCH transport system substrate-binding protein